MVVTRTFTYNSSKFTIKRSVVIQVKMALVSGLVRLNEGLIQCASLVSSSGTLYSAACSILATIGSQRIG
ncbi:unnamed protein product [Allacma fusca]|uniref:Uncharacterized protein n=1 Tax=Allacma fusca TaxID=39272 RepID=A0A8J2PCK3_9HEXA|nr:unnamed protein product [Allacma fusca]